MSNEHHPNDFFANEMKNALAEQQNMGGIKAFRIASSTSGEAVADVTLLEEETLEVILTREGYKVEYRVLALATTHRKFPFRRAFPTGSCSEGVSSE